MTNCQSSREEIRKFPPRYEIMFYLGPVYATVTDPLYITPFLIANGFTGIYLFLLVIFLGLSGLLAYFVFWDFLIHTKEHKNLKQKGSIKAVTRFVKWIDRKYRKLTDESNWLERILKGGGLATLFCMAAFLPKAGRGGGVLIAAKDRSWFKFCVVAAGDIVYIAIVINVWDTAFDLMGK